MCFQEVNEALIATQLHHPQMKRLPRIHRCRLDKTNFDTQTSVQARSTNAQVDAMGY
jgi:hypothetical protein